MQEVATFGAEAGGAIRHDALSLGGANFTAKVGLAGFAEFAVAAFGCTGKGENGSEPGISDGRKRGRNQDPTRAQQHYRLLSPT